MPLIHKFESCCTSNFNGEVAEWSIAAVLKTVGRVERPLGSNPSLSARGNLTAIF